MTMLHSHSYEPCHEKTVCTCISNSSYISGAIKYMYLAYRLKNDHGKLAVLQNIIVLLHKKHN